MSSEPNLAELAWPADRLPEALEAIAQRARANFSLAPVLARQCDPLSLQQDPRSWITTLAQAGGLEVETVSCSRAGLADMLGAAGPAIVLCEVAGTPMLLLLVRQSRREIQLIGPDLRLRRCRTAALAQQLNAACTQALAPLIEPVFATDKLNPRGRARAYQALLHEHLGEQEFADCWLVRTPPHAALWPRLRQAGLPGLVLAMSGLFCLTAVFEIAAWGLLGRGALGGNFDPGWLLAWVLLLVSEVPLGTLSHALQARIAISAGRILKQRILAGALALDPDQIRSQGAGHLLARVLESQAFEALLMQGGFACLLALIELACAAWALAQSSQAGWLIGALLLTLLVLVLLTWRNARALNAWTTERLRLSHALTESLVGHRTRAVQEPAQYRHRDEDLALERYLDLTQRYDQSTLPLYSGIPRGWMLFGLAALSPALLDPASSPVTVGIGLGGVMLAGRSFSSLVSGLGALIGARIAWRQVQTFFQGRDQDAENPGVVLQQQTRRANGETLLELRNVSYRYHPHAQDVLSQCSLAIRRGERLLIEGPSGGGKSTLAALFAGWRSPSAGLALLNGFDRTSLGAGWRRQATVAPQFHENHILNGTLAFNLLMGREWPASEDDLVEAGQVCVALGLGPLVQRMPGGLLQMVGETGWQLSHGERSRVFLARAMLQGAELVVLDESFGALDPATLAECLRYVMAHAPTLAVIAHP